MTIINKIKKTEKIKKTFLKLILNGSKYHLGGSLSSLDLITTIVYGGFVNVNKKNIKKFYFKQGSCIRYSSCHNVRKKCYKKSIIN